MAVTLRMVPVSPLMLMVLGYTLACAPSTMVMLALLVAPRAFVMAPPRVKVSTTVPRSVAPSCSDQVAVTVPPHAPVAVR